MADQPAACTRCGNHFDPPPAVAGFRTLGVCPHCGKFVLVREQGEMTRPDDRADDSWGGVGWL